MSVMSPPAPVFGLPPYPVRRFTVDEFHQVIQTGILNSERVELLEGWIVPKVAHSPAHETVIDLVQEVLRSRLPTCWRLRIKSAITTCDSEPEPDVSIVRGVVRDHMTRHPTPEEISLLFEVADSSLTIDRKDKARLYARAGIAIYWIFNLIDFQVEVYTDPTGPDASPAYRQRQEFARGTSVPLVIGSQQVGLIPVNELLP